MTVIRSALFAGAALAAGFSVYEASVEPAPGTAAPYGHGALGGAAIATQPLVEVEAVSATEAAPATAIDRQGRSITVRRRTTRPSDITTEPEHGTTPSSRANPDSQDQGIGGGDTYDRNR